MKVSGFWDCGVDENTGNVIKMTEVNKRHVDVDLFRPDRGF
jgi:hypothetical protein